jgi:hypothetical protein
MDNNGLSLEQLRARRKEEKARAERRRRERREYLERAIKVYPNRTAEESYRRLQSNGLKSTDLLAELMRKLVEVKPTRYRKTAKAVTAFTDGIKAMADEIENDRLYAPDGEFVELLGLLWRYAEHVQDRYRQVQQSRKGRPLPR